MNVFSKFDEIPSMTLQDIKETKRHRHTFFRSFGRTDNLKTVYPQQYTLPQTQFAGGIKIVIKQAKFSLICQITNSCDFKH